MRVLHVIPTLDHASGGPSQALVGLAAAQQGAGLDVTAAIARATPGDRVLIDELRASGVEVRAGGDPGGDLAGGDLGRLVERCDVCHIHALWESIQHRAAVSCRGLGRPHVFRPCGMLDPWSLAQGRLKKRLYLAWRLRRHLDRCTAIHFTTTIERDLVAPLRFAAPAIVEPNGVSLGAFADPPAAGSFRSSHPEIGRRPLVLFMSRLHRKKGLELLVPAFAGLRARDAMLVIAGPDEGGYRATVERLIEAEGAGDRVIVTGMLEGAARIAALADADLFVLPSHQENFGIVVIEALAAGTPVIVSDQVNIHPEISSGQVGAVVGLSVEALRDQLDRWLGDEGLRAAAARRARPFVAERYDWNAIARRWADRYAGMVG